MMVIFSMMGIYQSIDTKLESQLTASSLYVQAYWSVVSYGREGNMICVPTVSVVNLRGVALYPSSVILEDAVTTG